MARLLAKTKVSVSPNEKLNSQLKGGQFRTMIERKGKSVAQTKRPSFFNKDSMLGGPDQRDKESHDLLQERLAMSILNSPNYYSSSLNFRQTLNRQRPS